MVKTVSVCSRLLVVGKGLVVSRACGCGGLEAVLWVFGVESGMSGRLVVPPMQ